jgi:hypothetical protein
VPDRRIEFRLRSTETAASVQRALDSTVLRPLLDLVVIAVIRQQRFVGFFVGLIGHDNGAPIEGASSGAEYSARAAGALRRRACYRRRMGQVFDLILSLIVAAMMVSLLGVVAQDAGMTAEAVRLNALSVAGLLMAAVAGSILLKRR